ncbi:MAG: hypothetical protein IPF66_23680 [Holophagales bacterium]|nr:hypothetical protein [Holophagales bacterium]
MAVALLEPGSAALVTIVDDTGLVRGERHLEADAPLFWQQAVGELASDPEIPLGRVEVRVLSGSAVAYAAVVDNVTGDGLLALARRAEMPSAPPFALLLPGAARAPGANGTLWRTGLRLANPGPRPGRGDARSPRRRRTRVAKRPASRRLRGARPPRRAGSPGRERGSGPGDLAGAARGPRRDPERRSVGTARYLRRLPGAHRRGRTRGPGSSPRLHGPFCGLRYVGLTGRT